MDFIGAMRSHSYRKVHGTSKIIDICYNALASREELEKIINADAGCKQGDMKKKKLGDVTSINITALQSGVSQDGGKTHALNVMPLLAFDIRISPEMDISAMGKKLDAWFGSLKSCTLPSQLKMTITPVTST
ncbi:hypothetical protein Pcac1_g9899 [Phytophthora cactorum]|uniref:Uncharacterized protein n=2 Tax=Phytophthora cactorum TaxID=29920 RepID=A0A8T1AV16_9STRA|nr:hypothetical protein Pcac1_g9899 [Phytophthora cactorum]KAG2801484.1 hypothetical protein PC112_g20022 [Phytophthora cactorum]KAG2801899.1 hypothetical protein PC111_g19346 [Phytophthora cactorum]KAG2880884.1 hypothetical protein PC114_g21849 [Phytophthora cactorum]KAG2887647.1 hypothetical protein PC115_g20269 [Phytophthora cactorum]